MSEENNEAVEQACVPCFVDSEGYEVHIGDLVSWVNTGANGRTATRAGRVLGINWMADGCDALKCMVKVKGSSSNIPAAKLTLMEDETLCGKLRRMVAACEGKLRDAVIVEVAFEIEQMFAPEGEDAADGEDAPEGGEQGGAVDAG